MLINNIETVGADGVDNIYAGLNEWKHVFVKLLEKDGYRFIANNYQNMHNTKKWDKCTPVRVANSHKRSPRYLWAVKPGATNDI